MQKLLVSTLFALSALASQIAHSYGVHEDHPYNFTITKDSYKFSEIYQINSQVTYPGSVKKSSFRIRTNYDLSNKDGWQATGITRILSLGTVFPWAQDIDVYDTRNVQIGMIDGELATLESAKFSLYDYDEAGVATLVGVAYANPDFTRFAVLSSSSNPHPIADLNRNFSDNSWSVAVHYPEKIDDRLIRVFAGFVVDYQDKFLSVEEELVDSSQG